jgi:hypothetical protein
VGATNDNQCKLVCFRAHSTALSKAKVERRVVYNLYVGTTAQQKVPNGLDNTKVSNSPQNSRKVLIKCYFTRTFISLIYNKKWRKKTHALKKARLKRGAFDSRYMIALNKATQPIFLVF